MPIASSTVARAKSQLATAGWPEASYAAGSLDDAHTKRATLVTDDSLALISTFHEDR